MADMPSTTNLSRLARLMARLSAAGAVLVPLAVAAIFLAPFAGTVTGLDWNGMSATQIARTPFDFRAVAFLFALAPTGFTVWALWSLKRLFQGYAQGDVFSHHALRMLNHVAVALFASVITGFVMQLPITLLLSWYRGEGHRALTIGIGSHEVSGLFLAGAVLVIARVMAEARRVADENESFV